MNERINELWNLSRNDSGRGHDEQKFAELIARECASQCLSDDRMRILNYFGIKE
jgi:hypothetical protein